MLICLVCGKAIASLLQHRKVCPLPPSPAPPTPPADGSPTEPHDVDSGPSVSRGTAVGGAS